MYNSKAQNIFKIKNYLIVTGISQTDRLNGIYHTVGLRNCQLTIRYVRFWEFNNKNDKWNFE